MNPIKKTIERYRERRRQYKKNLDALVEIFQCGELLWRKINELKARKVFVESFYNGNHVYSDFKIVINLNWRGLVFELTTIRPRNMFDYYPILDDVSEVLAKKWNDKDLKRRIWRPRWWKDDVEITDIVRLTALTAAMISDFEHLVPKTTQDEANKYADDIIRQVLKPIKEEQAYFATVETTFDKEGNLL